MRRALIPALVLLIGAVTLWQRQMETILPAEAWATVELIEQGGPFPNRQDGQSFGNREGLLPDKPRGYYREYTVPTPGSRDRGARRIVTGGTPPSVWYYSDDHYRSFRSINVTEHTSP